MTKDEREVVERGLEVQATRFPAVVRDRMKTFEKRVEKHLLQEAVEENFSDSTIDALSTTGNTRIFGIKDEIPPPIPGEAWTLEAPFPIFSCQVNGKIMRKVVTLRCWSDVGLERMIEINGRMAQSVAEGSLKKDAMLDIMTVTVVMWLRLRGQFFWLEHENSDTKDASESMFFDGHSMRLMKIASNDFKTWLHAHSGINPANERAWKQMIETIKTATTNPDISKGVKPGILFDRRGDVIYISCGSAEMARVSSDGVRMVPNGTDGVVFALGKTVSKWNLLDEKDGKNPFRETQVFGNANYESPHGRMIATMWFLSMPACIKNYPIILFLGRYRSGKTRFAQALFELLGVPVNLNSIRDNGQEDFWATLNAGGLCCFDNVDGKIAKWFPNDIQIASTGGSTTRRKMYTDDQTVVLRSLAKIVMTANDPKFTSDSGISDRILTVSLGPFTSDNKKDSEDQKLTDEIVGMRDSAFTWMCYTLSRALGDDGDVAKNLNKRHPDFARFALKVSRALNMEAEGTAALLAAEFDKSYQTLVTDRVTQMIYEVIRCRLNERSEEFEFTSSEMLSMIKERFKDQIDEFDKQLSNRVIGKVMNKHISELGACFKFNPPRTLKGITRYKFIGFTDNFNRFVKKEEEPKVIELSSTEEDDCPVF